MERYDGLGDAADDAADDVTRDADFGVADLLPGLAADPDSELVPEQVSALFAVALHGEPPSSVTAESVLREVRAAEAARPVRFLSAEWFSAHTAAWKWGGGLVAAAAVVGAVVVTAPGMGSNSAAGDAMLSAESAAAQSDSAPQEAAGAASMDESSQQLAEPPSGSSESAAEGALEQPSSASADALSGDASDQSYSMADGDTASGSSGGASDSSGKDGSGDSAGGLGGERQAYPLAPLTDAEWTAAIGALPPGISFGHVTDGADVESATLRGATIGLWSQTDADYIIIVTGADTGPGTDQPGDLDTPTDDTVGSAAARMQQSGLISVQVADGANRVAVAATERTLEAFPGVDLERIAQAVLAAAG